MSPIILLPIDTPPPPSGLLGVVYSDTFGGLSLTHLDVSGTSWTAGAATMWSNQDQSPWSSVAINTTVSGSFCGLGNHSDLTYCSTTDELYWSGAGATSLERVARASGASVGSITPPAFGNVHSIAYDKINDEFHISMFNPPGGAGGSISSFIPRATVDAGAWPTGGPTVYFTLFGGGMNAQEQPSLAWDELGSGAVNGPHPGTVWAGACGYGSVRYISDWAGDGTNAGTFGAVPGYRSLAIDNLISSSNIYVLNPGVGSTVTIQRFGINPSTAGTGSATMTSAELPNYDNSGFVYLYEYT